MKPYIEDRNGIKYEFNFLNRKQKVIISKLMNNLGEEKGVEEIENIVFTLLKFNYSNMTRETYEDILDYNEETYGFGELYEMLGYIIEDVFTLVGGETPKKENPYLQMKREQKQIQAQEV